MRQLGSLTTKALMIGTVAGVVAFGATDQAQAGAKAFASLQIIDAIVTDTADVQLNVGQFVDFEAANGGSFGGSVTGGIPFLGFSLNGGGCSGAGCPPAETGVNMNDINTSGQFARAFNTLAGSVIGPGGVDSDTVAETILTDTGVGGANSFTGSTIDFTFTLANSMAIRLAFDAIFMLHAELHQDEVSSLASGGWSINIVDPADVVVLSYAPDGTGDCGGSLGCTVLFEAGSLNEQISQLSTGDTEFDTNGFFQIESGVLLGNVEYTVTIAQDVNVLSNAIKAEVPEPASLMLFGTSLLGLGLIGLRRRRQTAA